MRCQNHTFDLAALKSKVSDAPVPGFATVCLRPFSCPATRASRHETCRAWRDHPPRPPSATTPCCRVRVVPVRPCPGTGITTGIPSGRVASTVPLSPRRVMLSLRPPGKCPVAGRLAVLRGRDKLMRAFLTGYAYGRLFHSRNTCCKRPCIRHESPAVPTGASCTMIKCC